LNNIKLHTIIDQPGLWPGFLTEVFSKHHTGVQLPFSSDAEGIKQALKERNYPVKRRQLLADVLLHQNANALHSFPKIKRNIELLRNENTFTITTGHQLSLAGGPLFLWYKLCSVVAQAAYLSRAANSVILPVFWMASEDHDLQELNDFSLFGKKINFEPDFHGAAGQLKRDSYASWAEEFSQVAGHHDGQDLWLAFLKGENLAEATRNWVNSAFGEYGLLVIDANDASLKNEFLPLALTELESGFSGSCVASRTAELIASGIASEKDWPVHPRNLNLFWFDENGRHRLVRHADNSISAGADAKSHTIQYWKERFLQFPQNISPNVILRPIYQEIILPNLAYIGGPGECAYWLQLLSAFNQAQVFYPVVLPRRNFLLLPEKQLEFLKTSGFEIVDLLKGTEEIIRKTGESGMPDFLRENSDIQVQEIYNKLIDEIAEIDRSLISSIQAEQQKTLNGLQNIRVKVARSLRQKDEQKVNRLLKIAETIRPSGKPQERAVHLFQYSLLCRKENVEILLKSSEEPGIKGLYIFLI